MQDLFAFRDLLGDGTDQDAGGEIAEDGAEPETLEQRRCDHGAGKQHERLRIDYRCRFHARCFRYNGRGARGGGLVRPDIILLLGRDHDDALDACFSAQ